MEVGHINTFISNGKLEKSCIAYNNITCAIRVNTK